MITTFSAEAHEYGEWYNKRYTIGTEFVVKDLRGVAEVNIELYELSTGKLYASHTYSPGVGYTVITAGWVFDVDYWTLKAYGYNVKGTVKGESGLSVSAKQKISGIVSMVVDAIMALGAMLLGGLQKAWEAVANAVNVIVEWVKATLTQLFQPVIDAIKNSILNYLSGLNATIHQALDEYNNTQQLSTQTLKGFDDFLTGGLFVLVMGLVIALNVAIAIITPLTCGMGFLVMLLISLLLTLIIQSIVPTLTQPSGGAEDVHISADMGIRSVLSYMKDYIEGKLGGGKVSILSGMSPLIKFILLVMASACEGIACGLGYILAVAVDIAIEDVTGVATTMLGTTIAFISFILALFSVVTSGIPDMVLAVTLSLLGIILSGIGLFLGIVSLMLKPVTKVPQLMTNICVSMALNGLAIFIGFLCLYIIQLDP